MIQIRYSRDRGYADLGWLESYHSFSFGSYFDPAHMGFGNLRVLNEDRIAVGGGFEEHGHRDMEIISYVLSGALAHQDSLGNLQVIPPGDLQRMTAGTGVRHSEFNHAKGEATHFLQIWLLPKQNAIAPSYQQKSIALQSRPGTLVLVASGDSVPSGAGIASTQSTQLSDLTTEAQSDRLSLNADAKLYAGIFKSGQSFSMGLDSGRKSYVHLISGELTVNGQSLASGDAAMLSSESQLQLSALQDAHVLVFDLTA